MTVKEILQQAATLSGRDDVVKYLNSSGSATEDTILAVNVMVRLINMVVSELSASFIPLIVEEKINATEKIKYTSLSKNAIEIIKVYDQAGKEIPFSVYYDHVKISSPCSSIKYKYAHSTYGLEDTLDYTEKDIPSAVLAYGLSAEFALSEGDFDRACSLHDRYVEGVHAICKPKNHKTKARVWQ
ncbi:MAG: hypothetical protein IJX16_02315 [Clostridia bacterium]|nr:hypothetical protein [Clostridia bacterium]